MIASASPRGATLLGALFLVAFAACDTNSETPTSPDVEPGGDTSADASVDALDVTEPDTTDVSEPDVRADVADDADSDTDETNPDALDDVDDVDVVEPECEVPADCPDGFDCDEGVCIQRCVRDSECDDLNVCTRNICVDSVCTAEIIAPAPVIADETAGDCRRQACIDGVLSTFPDRTDRPEDDGIFCTVEECRGTFAVNNPDNSLCDDGISTNGEEVCSVAAGGCILGGQPDWYCDPVLIEWDPEEICDDGQDNDGDGLADEGCACEFGDVQRCYTGPQATRTVGGCLDGYQRCVDRDAPRWGACEGQILPADEELCDLKDNDCNDCVDDMPECDPLLSCPTEDFARPLRDYALDVESIFDLEELAVNSVTWTVIPPANSGTTGAENPSAMRTSTYLDVSGDYQIGLQLDTDKGLLGCSWVVHVAGSGLRVEMRWNTFGRVDMDLHLLRNDATRGFCTDDDCYYANCRNYARLGWGYPSSPPSECDTTTGSCNNPRLDIDNISGYDPENINIDNPNHLDTFRVMAHMFSGSATTNPVLSIYCGGRLRGVIGEAPDVVNLTSSSSSCRGHTWRVADVSMIVDPDTGFTDCALEILDDGAGDWDLRLNDASR